MLIRHGAEWEPAHKMFLTKYNTPFIEATTEMLSETAAHVRINIVGKVFRDEQWVHGQCIPICYETVYGKDEEHTKQLVDEWIQTRFFAFISTLKCECAFWPKDIDIVVNCSRIHQEMDKEIISCPD